MNILVLGAGAMGGYYGARLLQAGAEVTFLVRPSRKAQLQRDGLTVRGELGGFAGPVHTITRDELKSPFDLVVVSCKGYDLKSAIDDIEPAVGPRTGVLPWLNGLAPYDRLDDAFGRDRVLGGVAYVATALQSDGVITQQGRQDKVIVGARTTLLEPLASRFHQLLSRTPGERLLSTDIEQALWDKWVMLCAGAAMNCLMRGSVADILCTAGGQGLMEEAIVECLEVASREGHALSESTVSLIHARLLDTKSTWAASMMRDIAAGVPRLETETIVGDMVRRASTHRLTTPLLRAAYCHLEVYESR
jgi:2-dehydropantoate 2-reductase